MAGSVAAVRGGAMISTLRQAGPGAAWDAFAVAAVCAVFTIGARYAFPEMDDGYLQLILKEAGVSQVAAAHPDRPLVGWLWQICARLFGGGFWAFGFASHFLLWWVLGWQTMRLWRILVPGLARYAGAAGVLAVAPIVVRTQLSTVTISLLCVLSTVLAYGGVLLFLRWVRGGDWKRAGAASGLMVAASAVSEYGLPVALASVALSWFRRPSYGEVGETRRRRIAGAAAVLSSLAGYLIYHLTGHPEIRSELSVSQMATTARILEMPFSLATRFWHVVAGAYGTVIGAMLVSWSSKASLAAVLFGGGLAALLGFAAGKRQEEPGGAEPPVLPGILAAVAAALAPVVVMRPIWETAFTSRFYIPALPVAAAATLLLALSVADAKKRTAVVAFVGLVAGFAVVTESAAAKQNQDFLRTLGKALQPQVEAAANYTVAVLSSGEKCGSDYGCTAKVTQDWPAGASRKMWVYPSELAVKEIGARTGCPASPTVNDGVRSIQRVVHRQGPISNLLWVEITGDRFRIEPYCLTAH